VARGVHRFSGAIVVPQSRIFASRTHHERAMLAISVKRKINAAPKKTICGQLADDTTLQEGRDFRRRKRLGAPPIMLRTPSSEQPFRA
jgi:hypothetical protein